MIEMVKGANVGLASLSGDAGTVVASLSWSSETGEADADVSVLLLNDKGKVRGDADLFFYNNPAAADGSVQLLGTTPTADGDEDRISLDLSALPADVEHVVVAASRDAGARFGDLDGLRLTVSDPDGDAVLGFSIQDAGDETAFVFGEFYRRGAEWKFRAVGQGYGNGLAGLATDFGIDVDEEEEPEEAVGGGSAEAPDGGFAEVVEERVPAEPSVAAVPAVPAASVASAPAAPAAPVAPAAPEPSIPAQAAAPAVPAVPSERAAPARRPRTAKKKVTLPRTAKPSLADNDTWRQARLFPVPGLKHDRERETRATSVLLSVMAQVPEFGRRLIAGFGAPAGRMETFTEVTLPNGEAPRRPDGVIRVERAGKLWTALVETKTNGNPLKAEQVQGYMDIASRRGYEAVITLSNDVALEGSPLVDVRTDGRRKHKVALWHLSWAEVAAEAQTLIRHEGVGSAAHAWLLQELLHYLQHDNSGCHGFQNMGPAWVPVRDGIDQETLCRGDKRALEVVESWERLVRQVCLRLGGELGRKVLPVQRAKRGADPAVRRAALADVLCEEGRLDAEIRIGEAPGVLVLTADLRRLRLRTSIDLTAPAQGYPLTWAKRLVRQLGEAPADLHIETLTDGETGGPRSTLERLRPEPANLLPPPPDLVSGFRLTLIKSMGNTRGQAPSGFIRSVDDAVDRFRTHVVAPLERRPLTRG